jgi:hypothetical protein
MNQVVHLHGKPRPHKGCSWNIGVTVPLYCPYSADLTFADSHLVGPLGNAFRERLFAVGDDLKHSVREELRRFSKGYYAKGIYPIIQRWENCVNMEISWKNNLNFVKDVPTKYVTFIIIVITISEKKKKKKFGAPRNIKYSAMFEGT